MLSEFARNITYFFVKKNLIKKDESEIYKYGCEILLAEIINWLITAVIAIFTHTILESAVYMLVFIQMREAIGGFHAKTHMGCTVLSAIVHIVFVFLIIKTPMDLYWILVTAGIVLHMVLVLLAAPVAHPNKPFTDEREYVKFKRRSYGLSVLCSLISVLLMIMTYEICRVFSYCIMLAMLSASISMMVEYIIQKYKRGGEEK